MGGPTLAVIGVTLTAAAALTTLVVLRHLAWWTARFDVGNMWQAVWATAHGHPLLTTDIAGRQISRLAAHVDPLLLIFTPLAWVTDSPLPMLVLQGLLVVAGVVPLYALARRWLGAGWPAACCALAWPLAAPLWWVSLDEMHPVALAAPLLVTCVWAIETRRDRWLVVAALLAALSKEQVGVTLACLGLWMAVRHGRRAAGALLAALSLAWVAVAVWVIIPHFNDGAGSAFVARYGAVGDSEGEIVRHLVTHPWQIATVGLAPDRLGFLAALLLPMGLLMLAAPSLAAVAIPELALNLVSSWPPQHSVEFHYVAVPAGILLPAAVLGAARLRGRWGGPRGRALPAALAAASAVGLLVTGPLPGLGPVSVASASRVSQYSPGPDVVALDRAATRIPPWAPVSVGNYVGGHLSARTYVATFPVIGRATYVMVDTRRPTIGFQIDRKGFAVALARLLRRPGVRLIFDRDGVLVARLPPRA